MRRLMESMKGPWPRWGTGVLLLGLFLSPAALAQTTAGVPPTTRNSDRPGLRAAPLLSPNTGHPGETLSVEAMGLRGASGTNISFTPKGLSVSGLSPTDRGTRFQLAIAADARLGAYALVVSGRDRPPQFYPGAFTVLPPLARGTPARILRVEPNQVEAGKTYSLTLFGTGFSPGMSVDFGHDVHILAPPVVQDDGRANLQVLISPTALEGVHLASVRAQDQPFVKGPGGIQVMAPSPKRAGTQVQQTTPPKIEVAVPSGKIFLRAPNITGSGEFVSQHMGDDPPLVQQGTQFTWFEQNPGVAQYYILTIKDKSGKVLAQVQTPASKNYYRVTKQLLLSLPTYTPEITFHFELPGINAQAAVANAGSYAPRGGTVRSQKSQALLKAGLPHAQGGAPLTADQIKTALAQANALGNLTAMVDPDLHLIKPTDHADATWSVTGYWKHPITRQDMAVETSENYPLKLPRQPHGMLTCDQADQPKAIDTVCADPKDPNNTRACLVGNDVVLSGSIRLDRDPYPVYASLHNFQDMAAQYINVYLSWGDGTVTPLIVDMTPSGQPTVKIQYQGAGLKHVYTDEGPFLIKIYSLPNPESSNPSLAVMGQSQGPYAQAFHGGTALGGTDGGAGSAQAPSGPMKAGGYQTGAAPSGTISTLSPGTMSVSQAGAAAAVLANDAYLIACVGVNPKYPEDMIATGPLNLVKIEVTGYPGHSEKPPQVPQVKDCSQGFTAQAALTYVGQGQVGWSWIVDGVEIPGGTRGIGPGGGSNSTATETLVSDPLPVALLATPHKLTVKAWVVIDVNQNLIPRFQFPHGSHVGIGSPGGTNVSQSTTIPGAYDSSQVVQSYAVLRPSLRAFTSLGTVVTASSKPGQGATIPPSQNPQAMPAVQRAPMTPSNGLHVGSQQVQYQVVAHDPETPCSLLFQTAKGPFVVTDLGDDFAQQTDGTYNGSGSLVLTLPGGQSGTEKILVPVTFKSWTLEGTGDGREVTQGSLDITPNKDLEVAGLTGKIAHLGGTADKSTGAMEVTFQLAPSSYSTLKGAAGGLTFQAKGPITPDGDFTAPGLSLPAADIGYSGYQVSASSAVLDLSRNDGDAPDETACNATGTGAQWIGLLLKSGTLKTGNISLIPVPLPNVHFTDWSIGPGGLSGRITGYPLNGSVPLGLTTIKVSAFDFFVCGNNLASTFTLAISDYPFINGTLSGKTTIDEHGVSQNTIDVPPVDKDFGTVHYKSTSGSFGFEQGIGWRVVLDGTFRFSAFGKPFYDGLALNGLQVLPSGKLRLDGGAHSQQPPMGGSGQLGQVTVDMTGADVVAVDYGGATAKALFFKLSAGFHLSTTLSVFPSTITYRLIPVTGQEGHFTAPDPQVADLHIENHYPYNSDINMNATLSYKDMGSGNTRFSGKAEMWLMSGKVDAEFLLGYQNGQDYWLTRVGYNLGASPVPILGPFLALYEVHGALGHNINFAQAVAGAPIDQIQPVFNGSYLFQAGCQVGDNMSGGWIYYFDGTFSVDTKQGARIDAKGWLLTNDHSGSAPLNGSLVYGGGSFTASLTADLSYMDGAFSIHGGVSILIGNNWHIWLGTDTQPVTAHALVVNCTGYLMLDGNGLRVGGGYSENYSANPSIWGVGVYVHFGYSGSFSLAISEDPTWGIHFDGAFNASISGGAGVSLPVIGNVGINLSGGLDLTASAMPVSVCGSVYLDFGCACFCPCSWRHPLTFHCCCKCFRTSLGVCLP